MRLKAHSRKASSSFLYRKKTAMTEGKKFTEREVVPSALTRGSKRKQARHGETNEPSDSDVELVVVLSSTDEDECLENHSSRKGGKSSNDEKESETSMHNEIVPRRRCRAKRGALGGSKMIRGIGGMRVKSEFCETEMRLRKRKRSFIVVSQNPVHSAVKLQDSTSSEYSECELEELQDGPIQGKVSERGNTTTECSMIGRVSTLEFATHTDPPEDTDSSSDEYEDHQPKKKRKITSSKSSRNRTALKNGKSKSDTIIESIPEEFHSDGFLLTSLEDDRFEKYLWTTPMLLDHLALKAVYTRDFNLLKKLAPEKSRNGSAQEEFKPTSILRQASLNRPYVNALVEAILQSKVEFFEEIILQETLREVHNSHELKLRPSFPVSGLLIHDSGSVGYRAYNAHISRFAIGVGRGGKEGNQAFARDIESTYGKEGPRLNGSVLANIIASLLIRKVEMKQLKGFWDVLIQSEFNDRAEYHLSTNLGLAARLGRDDLLRWMLGIALRCGGIGLNSLHLEVLGLGCSNEVRKNINELLSKLNEDSTVDTTISLEDSILDVVGISLEETLLSRFRKVSWTKKATGNFQITPLLLAAINRNGNTNIFQTMIEGLGDSALTDCCDEHGWTVLHYSAVNNSTHLLRWLLEEKKAQVNIRDDRGFTPIMAAAYAGNINSVKLLMNAGADLTLKSGTVKGRRVARKRPNSHANVISIDPYGDLIGLDAYQIAVAGGSKEVVTTLLNSSPVPMKVINTPERGQKSTLVHRAAMEGKFKLLELFLELRGSVKKRDKFGRTPLMVATMNGNVKEMTILIEYGANVNDVDNSGNSALHYACAYGWIHCAALLIEAKADINRLNSWRSSPASIALLKCHYGLVEWLIDNVENLDPNLPDEDGLTLIHVFCRQAKQLKLDIIKRLVKKKVDVNRKASKGKRPVHFLAETLIPEEPTKPENPEKQSEHDGNEVSPSESMDEVPIPIDRASSILKISDTFMRDRQMECNSKAGGTKDLGSNDTKSSGGNQDRNIELKQIGILAPQQANDEDVEIGSDDSINGDHEYTDHDTIATSINTIAQNNHSYTNTSYQNQLLRYQQEKEERDKLIKSIAESVEILAENGADLNVQDSYGQTVLQLAVENHNATLVQVLFQHGVNIEVQNRKGHNLLHLLCKNVMHAESITLLEAMGIAVSEEKMKEMAHIPDVSGKTPLILAVATYCEVQGNRNSFGNRWSCSSDDGNQRNVDKEQKNRDLFFAFIKILIKLTSVSPMQQTRPIPFKDEKHLEEEGEEEGELCLLAESSGTDSERIEDREDSRNDLDSNSASSNIHERKSEKQRKKEMKEKRENLEQRVTEDRIAGRHDDPIRPIIWKQLSTDWSSTSCIRPKSSTDEVIAALRLRLPNRLMYDWNFGRRTPLHYFVEHQMTTDIKLWMSLTSTMSQIIGDTDEDDQHLSHVVNGKERRFELSHYESTSPRRVESANNHGTLSLAYLQDIHGVTPMMLIIQKHCENKTDSRTNHNASSDSDTSFIPSKIATPISNQRSAHLQIRALLSESSTSNKLLNATKFDGATVLMMAACSKNMTDIVQLLLELGADPSIPDVYGRTVAHACCYRRDEKLLETLMLYEVDFEKTDNYGRTPLHFAMSQNNGISFDFETRVLEYIVKIHGEDVDNIKSSPTVKRLLNVRDCNGRTLCHSIFLGLVNGVNRLRLKLPATMFTWEIKKRNDQEKEKNLFGTGTPADDGTERNSQFGFQTPTNDGAEDERDRCYSVTLAALDSDRIALLSSLLTGAVPTSINGESCLVLAECGEMFKSHWISITGCAIRLNSEEKKEQKKQSGLRRSRFGIKTEEESGRLQRSDSVNESSPIVIDVEEFSGPFVEVEFAVAPLGFPLEAKDPIEVVTNLCAFKDAPLHAQEHHGISCLAAAAAAGSTISALTLLQRGCDLEMCNNDLNTVLAIALQNNHFDLAIMLIMKSAITDCSIKSWDKGRLEKSTPFRHCILHKKYGISYLLLQESFPFFKAVVDSLDIGELALVLTLLNKITDETVILKPVLGWGGTVLHILCSSPQSIEETIGSRLIRILISLGIDPTTKDNKGCLPLHYASGKMHMSLIKPLLSLTNGLETTRDFNDFGWLPVCEVFFRQCPSNISIDQAKNTIFDFIKQLAPRKPGVSALECTPPYIDSDIMSQTFPTSRRSKFLLNEIWGLPLSLLGQNGTNNADNSTCLSISDHSTVASPTVTTSNNSNAEFPPFVENYRSTFLIEALKCDAIPAEFLVHEFLMLFQLNPNITDSLDLSPLIWSIKRNYQSLALRFIETQSNQSPWFRVKDVFGKTILYHTIQPLIWGSYENSAVIDALLKTVQGKPIVEEIEEARNVLDSVKGKISEKVASILHKRYPTLSSSIQRHRSKEGEGPPREVFERPNFAQDAATLKQMRLSSSTAALQKRVKPPPVHPSAKSIGGRHLSVLVDEDVFDVLLVKVDVSVGEWGENNFYHMQLLHQQEKDLYILFTRWGRVGETGMHQLTPAEDIAAAKKEFAKVFKNKTGIEFSERNESSQIPKRYFMVPFDRRSIKYKSLLHPKMNLDSCPPFNGHREVSDLLEHITDAAVYEEAMKSNNVDLDRMPLTRLSFEVLNEADQLLKSIKDQIENVIKIKQKREGGSNEIQNAKEKLFKLSNNYFTILPRSDTESEAINPLQTLEEVTKEIEKIKDLRCFSLSVNIILGSIYRIETIHPYNYCLQSLGIALESMSLDDPERRLVTAYFYKTLDHHVLITKLFRIHRYEDDERFLNYNSPAVLSNRRLLWHGTSTCNLMGIFHSGLRVAPMTANFTGAAFGEGIYFADMAAKSIKYAHSRGTIQKPKRYLYLCEVAIGTPKIVFRDEAFCNDPWDGINGNGCLWVVGKRQPDWNNSVITPDGVQLPITSPITVDVNKLPLTSTGQRPTLNDFMEFSEYVVRSPAQVKLKYMIEIGGEHCCY